LIRAAYLAAEGFEAELAEELRRAGRTVAQWHGRLALSPEPPVHAAWALDTWTEPTEVPAPSIAAAAGALRAIQRNWSLYAASQFRRAALIEARLPPVKAARWCFPNRPPPRRSAPGRCSKPTACWRARPRPAPSSTASRASWRTAKGLPPAPT
jgi:23S rRNA (cytidine2498-2'-O)-methyltransferase